MILLIFVLVIPAIYSDKNERIESEKLLIKSDSITNALLKRLRTDSITNEMIGFKPKLNSDSTISNHFTYLIRNNKIVSYRQLSIENDSLTIENSILNSKLELALKNYDIKFSTKFNKNKYNHIVEIEAKQLDSALMILAHFRKKLSYDSKEKTWNISQ